MNNDEAREAAVRRKMDNPAEGLLGNMAFGGMVGVFVGYMAGSLYGTMRWNMKIAAKQTHTGATIGFLVGVLGNGASTLLHSKSSQPRPAPLVRDVPPAVTVPKGPQELQFELDAMRERERATGIKLDKEKARVKRQIAACNAR